MKFARQDRSLIAWMQYACVLFNLFACGLHHGQMMGLQLSGIGGEFCASGPDSGPAMDDSGGAVGNGWSGTFSCPLCASITLSIAVLFGLAWLLRPERSRPSAREARCKAPPRYHWPSANPRASPQA
ncbi:DUF2946 domain-containing protein [Pseudomonas boanensis]|uniref:DUF2946 domain-containing protein n=1 Tax=Metapseudomonas boanensis TaxID=2822138 RepID=UPI0035D4DFD4